MKLFLDFEFTGLHKATTPISIAVLSEKGDYFYAEFTDYDKNQCSDWINKNIISNLVYNDCEPFTHFAGNSITQKSDKEVIAEQLRYWLDGYVHKAHCKTFEIWCDVGHYDKVLFDDLYGGAFNIPKCINYIFRDIATLLEEKGFNPDINRKEFFEKYRNEQDKFYLMDYGVLQAGTHNSLADAYLTRFIDSKLFNNQRRVEKLQSYIERFGKFIEQESLGAYDKFLLTKAYRGDIIEWSFPADHKSDLAGKRFTAQVETISHGCFCVIAPYGQDKIPFTNATVIATESEYALCNKFGGYLLENNTKLSSDTMQSWVSKFFASDYFKNGSD